MPKILITGATGNVGKELIKALDNLKSDYEIVIGSHSTTSVQRILGEFPNRILRKVDFTDPECFEAALENIDTVFLLRPPHLADISKYFDPFFCAMKKAQVNKIVFISVQGVENQTKIPHFKLEKLILEHQLEHVFLRPSYFMQNLTSTLLTDIQQMNKIFIPAGKLKFTWIDARDIGKVAARVLIDFDLYKNQILEITGQEVKNFEEVASEMSEVLGREILYDNPNLCSFYLRKKKLGVPNPMIFVMIMLHFLPRFQKQTNKLTTVVKDITGDDPGLLKDFLKREIKVFNQ